MQPLLMPLEEPSAWLHMYARSLVLRESCVGNSSGAKSLQSFLISTDPSVFADQHHSLKKVQPVSEPLVDK